MNSDTVWQHIDTERSWLADLLESLPEAAWTQPSLCAGWSVRDVAAHLTLSHARLRDLIWPAVRAGFRYDTIVREVALRSPLTHEQIVATLRGFVGSRRRVAFITDLEPLIDILVHTQDICLPLGVDHPMPTDASAAAAERVLSTHWPLRRWRPPQGVRLVATDTDWAYGSGPERRASMQEHLLTLTGRATSPSGSASPHATSTPEEER